MQNQSCATPAAPTSRVQEQAEHEEHDDMELGGEMSGDGSAATFAKTGQMPIETSASFKNFRHSPRYGKFLSFIFENDLRFEALSIIDTIIVDKQNKRNIKAAKTKSSLVAPLMQNKRYNLAPGPTPVPESVLSILSTQIIHHRLHSLRPLWLTYVKASNTFFKPK